MSLPTIPLNIELSPAQMALLQQMLEAQLISMQAIQVNDSPFVKHAWDNTLANALHIISLVAEAQSQFLESPPRFYFL